MPKCDLCPSQTISHTEISPKGKTHMCAYCYNKRALLNLKARMIDAIKDADLDRHAQSVALYSLEQIDIYES